VLLVDEKTRQVLWRRLIEAIEAYIEDVGSLRAAPVLDPEALRALIAKLDFERPVAPLQATDFVLDALRTHQVHTPHPRYFGLFNPAPTTMGIVADALVATFNPQLAAWSHSPFAAEVEAHVIRQLGQRFGYTAASSDGVFASGGAEANHTAVLAGLVSAFPGFADEGARSLSGQPLLYTSLDAHDSFLKAARLCGLGTQSVRQLPVGAELTLEPHALAAQVARDREQGFLPFLVAATAGTTNAGAVDPIGPIAEVAAREGLWLHVDAAWGGGAVLDPELAKALAGIEQSDSITFDAHKWLSVPMGAGVFLTRHSDILERTFRVAAGYMPREAEGMDIVDPYAHSMQWSRRFIGLKVFLSLAVAGWAGYAESIRHMTAMGERLRRRLASSGWEIVNRTPLPVVCFVDTTCPEGRTEAWLQEVAAQVVGSGQAWISTAILAGRTPALRACITNYRTGPGDVDALVDVLNAARQPPAILPG
jgi:glutamate/tyrosine decarboxylase-like PLP-dependent enzyme